MSSSRGEIVGCLNLEAGNLRAVSIAFDKLGAQTDFVSEPGDLGRISRLVIPGVGSFGNFIKKLETFRMHGPLVSFFESGKPILGICLGYQIMANASAEAPECSGLGFLDAQVDKLSSDVGEHIYSASVPHMGFNQVEQNGASELLSGIPSGTEFYFAHSFAIASMPNDTLTYSTTERGSERFVSVYEKQNVAGVQFHPEKSLGQGLRVLKNFLNYAS